MFLLSPGLGGIASSVPFSDARGRLQRPVGGKEGALLPASAKMVNRSRTRSSSSASQIFLAVLSVLATLTYAEIQHGRRLLQSPVWTREIDLVGEAVDDMFGFSVSMSADGKRVAIGAIGNDGAGSNAGHVRVYAESGGAWTQVGADINGEAAGDESGRSVSISADGTRVTIGADDAGPDAGHVRVYAESGGTWTQVGADIDGEAAGDESGRSVSMSADGTHVAIGAPCKELSCMTRGKAYVFAVGCDASTAPTNGGVGTCTSSLASGSTCQPTCNSGYTVSGTSSCSAGTLTGATCSANACDASTAPANGGVGTCTSSLASGSTCQPTCNSGYTVSGTSSCSAGTLTAATCAATSSPSTPTETANTESGGSRLVLDSALTLLIGTTFMLY